MAKNSLDLVVSDVLHLEEHNKYKLHLGCWNGEYQPLDEYVKSEENWKHWNEWRNPKTWENTWTREYIFSLIQFKPKKDTWLFGGIFKVIDRPKDAPYVIEEVETYKKFDGRLLLNLDPSREHRGRGFYLENFIDDFTVNQIFEEKYTGEVFPGFDNINHDFSKLESIFRIDKSDWKTALKNVSGIYLLTDKKTGKSYVGSASGEGGIWSRWSAYINNCHGGNKELVSLVNEKGPDYIKKNFKFTLLETYGLDSGVPIEKREEHWKEKLMTKEHGYNS